MQQPEEARQPSRHPSEAVFANKVLEHLRDPRRVLREFRRVLKPGGVVGVRDPDFTKTSKGKILTLLYTHADLNAAINIEHRWGDDELRACKDRKAVKVLLMQRHEAWKQQNGWP